MHQELRADSIARSRRARRVRAKLHGTAQRPRLSVLRTLKHISVQLIDDVAHKTVLSVSDTGIKATGTPREKALAVGKAAAELAKAKGVSAVLFDRGSYQYHGRVAAVAEGAREGGLTL